MAKIGTRLASLTSGIITGSGGTNEVAYFSSSTVLTSSSNMTFASGALNIAAPDADHTVLRLIAATTTGVVRNQWQNSDNTRSFEIDADFTAGAENLLIQSDSTTIGSITRAGQIQMIANGTVAAPAYAFGSTAEKKGSGIYFSSGTRIAHDGSNAAIFTKTGCSILGTTTNDNASAGYVGEYIESTGGDSAWAAASGDYANVASISLTPGDWDVCALADSYNSNAAGITLVTFGISTDSTANSFSDRADGRNCWQASGTASAGYTAASAVPLVRVSLASTTTYYLKLNLAFGAGTPHVAGYKIAARRVR